MNFLLIAFGSHGDVHPFVGLGLRLRERGHAVTVAANGHFQPLIERAGLGFKPLGTDADYRRFTKDPELWHESRGFRVIFKDVLAPELRPMYELSRDFADAHPNTGPDRAAVVASSLGLGARLAEDKLRIPFASAHLSPTLFRSVYDTPLMPGAPIGPRTPRFCKRMLYWFADRFIIDPVIGPDINRIRSELGLPPVKRILGKWLHSPNCVLGFFPSWFAAAQADWPPNVRLCGFPLYDERGIEPMADELKRFLDDGQPPIAFTPGSAMWQGRQFFDAADGACRLLGRRGLLLSRHLDHVPEELGQGVRHFAFAPFSELLPRCAALVHHGGIGTSSQAMCAGIPQVIMPMSYDQPDNAARMVRLGVARSIRPTEFTAPTLAEALGKLLDAPAVSQSCEAVAAKFAGVNALDDARAQVESLGM